MTEIHELETPLKRLRLSGILDTLEDRNKRGRHGQVELH